MSEEKPPLQQLGELLNECGMQVTVTGWKAELIAAEKQVSARDRDIETLTKGIATQSDLIKRQDAEITRLNKIYVAAVKGRQDFRLALKESRAKDFDIITFKVKLIKEWYTNLQDRIARLKTALREIITAGQMGDGTTAECTVVALAEDALATDAQAQPWSWDFKNGCPCGATSSKDCNVTGCALYLHEKDSANAQAAPVPDTCKCGHTKRQHIYEEGACRPGFVCESKCEHFSAAATGDKKAAPELLEEGK